MKTLLVRRLEDLPEGSHSLGFYGSPAEAARNMAGFLRGAQEIGQAARVLTSSDAMLELYRREASGLGSDIPNAVLRIPGPHIARTSDGFRPIPEVLEFVADHPRGTSVCGDTIPTLLDRRTLPDILAYEDWFDSLRPFPHRGLCPYDLAHLPIDEAPLALARLMRAHTHAALSNDPNPGTRFLQLLVLPYAENPSEEQLRWLTHALDYGLIQQDRPEGPVDLTPWGRSLARALLGMPALTSGADPTVARPLRA